MWEVKLPPLEHMHLKSPTAQPISVPTVGRQSKAQEGSWATSAGRPVDDEVADDVVVVCAAAMAKKRPEDMNWNRIVEDSLMNVG